MRFKILLFLGLFFWSVTIYSSDLIWHNPSHGPFAWRGINVTSNAFYLPSRGAFLRSTNARDWTLHLPAGMPGFHAIAASPDKIIAAGDRADHPAANPVYPAFFISTNGVDFKFLQDSLYYIYQLVYGKGRFVASGFEVLSSDNGLDWTRNTQIPSTDAFHTGDLIFGDGRFLRSTHVGVYVSEDGISWTQSGPPGKGLGYFNGLYALAGNGSISFSTNGYDWETQTVPAISPVALAIGTPGVVAVGDSLSQPAADAIFSADGTNWVSFTIPFSNRPSDIKFINGEYVMVGDGGLIAYSTDGTNWTKNSPMPRTVHTRAIARSEDRVIAVGNDKGIGAGLWSTNGAKWEYLDMGTPEELYAIAYAQGTFVAVGRMGQVVVSTNGGSGWFEPVQLATDHLHAVTTSPRGFVAVGRRTNIVSADGINWEAIPTEFLFSDIAYGNGVYIATGMNLFEQGGALISHDLVNWEFLPMPFRSSNSIEFGNGRFVLGPSGHISTDGTNWVQGTAPRMNWIWFSDGVFSANAGGTTGLEAMQGYVSVDGLHWHRLFELPQLGTKTGYYFGRFLAFTTNSGIVECDNFGFLDLIRNADGKLNFQRIHPGKFSSQIQSSTDLDSWEAIFEPMVSSPPEGNRYYRLKLEGR